MRKLLTYMALTIIFFCYPIIRATFENGWDND